MYQRMFNSPQKEDEVDGNDTVGYLYYANMK